jgi:hypothetical protein
LFEYLLRFIAGGIAIFAFAALGDALRPKSFAGLFGAAPSIALPTLLITLSHKGAPFASVEGRSMMLGAFALAAYSWLACLLLKKFMVPSWLAATAALVVCSLLRSVARPSGLASHDRSPQSAGYTRNPLVRISD